MKHFTLQQGCVLFHNKFDAMNNYCIQVISPKTLEIITINADGYVILNAIYSIGTISMEHIQNVIAEDMKELSRFLDEKQILDFVTYMVSKEIVIEG